MENFSESARKMKIWSSIVVGGTFSIFLTFSQAWSECLKEAIIRCTENYNNEDPLLQSFIYAGTASFICFAILILIYRLDKCFNDVYENRLKHLSRPRFRMSKSSAKLIIKKGEKRKSRKDIENQRS